MSIFNKGDLTGAFAATGIAYDAPEPPTAKETFDPTQNHFIIDDGADILQAAQDKANALDEKRKNFSFREDANENAGLQEIAQDIAGQNPKRQKEEEKKKAARSALIAQLIAIPEFQDYQVAFKEFKRAVDKAKDGQNKINDWKDAILLAQHEENFSDLKALLEENGHETDGMDTDEMMKAGMEELASAIKNQNDLIEVMKQKAEGAQEKLDDLLKEHPELKDNAEFITEFMQPHVEQLQALQELVEDQNSNLDFVGAQEQAARDLGWKNTLLDEFKTDDRKGIYQPNTENTTLNEEDDLDLLGDLGLEITTSSFAQGVDEAEPVAQSITQGFNAASEGAIAEATKSELETTIAVKVDGFKLN